MPERKSALAIQRLLGAAPDQPFRRLRRPLPLHLAVLSKAGLVKARREGTRALYSIKPEGFAPVAAFVESFWGGKLAALKREVEGKS